MNFVLNLVLVLQILSALVMVGLILVQHGKGADMGAAFGSGASGSLFGASGSANFLSRATAVLAGVFLVSTLALAYFGFSVRSAPASGGSSVLDRPAVAAPADSASAAASAAGAAAIPSGAAAIPVASAAKPAVPASGAAQIPTK
jgi:preprotein translocase subunit SecG